MRMYDLIRMKRDGGTLSNLDIHSFVQDVVSGTIPDYQISAFLMAVYFQGLNEQETATLTKEMANSGDTVDLSGIPGFKVDKHSTGGVGDKTTLIIGPIAAACGVKIAKMSGRGLGHTGGTVDKLESIPGFQTTLSKGDFIDLVNQTGLSVIGQSGNLCPADKKLYALRDVTATVESIPLIASSVMSKKIAAGADRILLDVKVGDGAFMKSEDKARQLAREMVRIGKNAGRETVALLTDMECPLGRSIGNALEIEEVCQVLQGAGPQDLTELCLILSAHMVLLGGQASTIDEAAQRAREVLESGAAFQKFKDMVRAQGGNVRYVEDTSLLPHGPAQHEVLAARGGYVDALKAETAGLAAAKLGAGRETKDSSIDFGAGIVLHCRYGDLVKPGDVLATMYTSHHQALPEAEMLLLSAYHFSDTPPKHRPLVLEQISTENI